MGQDLPVQFTLTQLSVAFVLPLRHLGVPSEMYKAKKKKRPDKVTVHLNCKKQEFAIQILTSKSQLIDLNILAAPIKIVDVLQQMAYFLYLWYY